MRILHPGTGQRTPLDRIARAVGPEVEHRLDDRNEIGALVLHLEEDVAEVLVGGGAGGFRLGFLGEIFSDRIDSRFECAVFYKRILTLLSLLEEL